MTQHDKATKKIKDDAATYKPGARVTLNDPSPLIGEVVYTHKHPNHVSPFVRVRFEDGTEVDWLEAYVHKAEAE